MELVGSNFPPWLRSILRSTIKPIPLEPKESLSLRVVPPWVILKLPVTWMGPSIVTTAFCSMVRSPSYFPGPMVVSLEIVHGQDIGLASAVASQSLSVSSTVGICEGLTGPGHSGSDGVCPAHFFPVTSGSGEEIVPTANASPIIVEGLEPVILPLVYAVAII